MLVKYIYVDLCCCVYFSHRYNVYILQCNYARECLSISLWKEIRVSKFFLSEKCYKCTFTYLLIHLCMGFSKVTTGVELLNHWIYASSTLSDNVKISFKLLVPIYTSASNVCKCSHCCTLLSCECLCLLSIHILKS